MIHNNVLSVFSITLILHLALKYFIINYFVFHIRFGVEILKSEIKKKKSYYIIS